jgi:hypothetical protein
MLYTGREHIFPPCNIRHCQTDNKIEDMCPKPYWCRSEVIGRQKTSERNSSGGPRREVRH